MPKVASTRRPQTKPKMGQHFLASEDLAARVVETLGDISQSTVLEIGPGPRHHDVVAGQAGTTADRGGTGSRAGGAATAEVWHGRGM